MADWNTRLEVTVDGRLISPISQFSPTFTTSHTPIHSIEEFNLGYIRQPQTFTFTMTVQAIGPIVAALTRMALDGTAFDVTVAVKQGDDWAFQSLAFTGCVITSAQPSNIVIDGAPAATFTCMSLHPAVT